MSHSRERDLKNTSAYQLDGNKACGCACAYTSPWSPGSPVTQSPWRTPPADSWSAGRAGGSSSAWGNGNGNRPGPGTQNRNERARNTTVAAEIREASDIPCDLQGPLIAQLFAPIGFSSKVPKYRSA